MGHPLSARRSLSVIVPAFNEQANLARAVRGVLSVADTVDAIEVVVVNDGSRDETGTIGDRLAAEDGRVRAVHHEVNRGFAAAYGTGLKHARNAYVTFAPGDNEVTASSLRTIYSLVGTADLVVPYHGTPWNRTRVRRVLTWLSVRQINLLFGWGLRYYQGPVVYPTALAQTLTVTTSHFFFASEMLLKALESGCTWVEVGLEHQDRAGGRSKATTLTNIVDAQKTILRTWINLRIRHQDVQGTDRPVSRHAQHGVTR